MSKAGVGKVRVRVKNRGKRKGAWSGAGRRLLCLLCVLVLGITAIPMPDVQATDRDKDGLITFSELDDYERNEIRRGYSPWGKFGFEKIFMMDDPYIYDVSQGNSLTVPNYHLMSRRILYGYYNKAEVRNDTTLYPNAGQNRWFVTSSWQEDGEWVAAVNYTGRSSKLITPETIRYDGHKCKVVTIDLANVYVRELTITDNITTIRRCQCPRLQEILGGVNVQWIANRAFMDCVSLVNFPYFPSLRSIGEFAFMGCLNLKEALLPPLIVGISWNAFGWFDVVLGNYDTKGNRQEEWWADFNEEDPDYARSGIYHELEKVKGITLYAAEGTDTFKTLEELFAGNDPRMAHLTYKEKKEYPGKSPVIDMDAELIQWLPPYEDPGELEWSGSWEDDTDAGNDSAGKKEADPQNPVTVQNALTRNQKVCLEYLEGLLLSEDINEDMFLTLIGSMVGTNPIPQDFIFLHAADAKYSLLEGEYLNASQKYSEAYKKREAKRLAEADRIEEDLYHQRFNLMYYVVNDLNYVANYMDDYLKSSGGAGGKNPVAFAARVASIIDHFNRCINYVKQGKSWAQAAATTLTTSVYLEGMSALMKKNPELLAYEVVIYSLFGNSRAGDAASIVTSGRHAVEFLTDFAYCGQTAMEYALQSPTDKRWDVYYTKWLEEVNNTFDKLYDTQNKPYGETVTNIAYLEHIKNNPLIMLEIFEGYHQQYKEGSIFYNFQKEMYDLAVKDNRAGEFLYDWVADLTAMGDNPELFRETAFGQKLYDWVVTYYSKTAEILNR